MLFCHYAIFPINSFEYTRTVLFPPFDPYSEKSFKSQVEALYDILKHLSHAHLSGFHYTNCHVFTTDKQVIIWYDRMSLRIVCGYRVCCFWFGQASFTRKTSRKIMRKNWSKTEWLSNVCVWWWNVGYVGCRARPVRQGHTSNDCWCYCCPWLSTTSS